MAWQIEFDEAARKELARLDRPTARRIVSFLRDRVAPADNPRNLGQALKGLRLSEFWKYRAGDYRIIVAIEDDALRVLVVQVGNRREVYR